MADQAPIPDKRRSDRALADVDEVTDSALGYLSLEALTETAAPPEEGPDGLCTACFTGNYPIPVEAQVQGKELLEGLAPQR